MNVEGALSDRTRLRIFYLLLKKEFDIKELAEELDQNLVSVMKQLDILKKAGLVRYRYSSGKKDASKIYSLTYEGIWKEVAKNTGKQITKNDIETLDAFYLDPKVRQIIINKIKEVAGKKIDMNVHTLVAMGMILSDITSMSDILKEKDKELKKKWKKVESVKKKLIT